MMWHWYQTFVLVFFTTLQSTVNSQSNSVGLLLGDSCQENFDCSQIEFSHCNQRTCRCLPYHMQHNKTTCLPAALLGFQCLRNEQCWMKVANSECTKDGVCRCSSGFTQYRRDLCLSGAKTGSFCANSAQCQLSNEASLCKFIIPKIYGRCVCKSGYTDTGNGRCVHLPPKFPVSLGKSCFTNAQCKSRDPFSFCMDGTCQCLKNSSNCNSAKNGCHNDTFQCRNGRCISWHFVCNGRRNCEDGSDEEMCLPFKCSSAAFQCSNGDCISKGKVCNGRRDCADGSDETMCFDKCHSGTFRCTDGTCLPKYTFCNAVSSCKDESDEDPSICETGYSCPNDQFQCDNGKCRSTAILCSGKDGCGDNSDESRCKVCYCDKP